MYQPATSTWNDPPWFDDTTAPRLLIGVMSDVAMIWPKC